MLTASKSPSPRVIDGVAFEPKDNYAVCHVKYLSNEIKELIRKNLATICHGSQVSDFKDEALFTYKTTLASFLGRYTKKAEATKLGMIGEFLAHILISELLPDFTVVSAFFNLEEKSQKKGFDILLYKTSDKSMWITEVKSGRLHKDKDHNQTTRDLLNLAKGDLECRLNAQEPMYWHNAINHVRNALSEEKDYRGVLLKIITSHGNKTAEKKATSKDKSVILVSSLFETCDTPVTLDVAASFLESVEKGGAFSRVIVFCMQKTTHTRIAEFLESEAAGGA